MRWRPTSSSAQYVVNSTAVNSSPRSVQSTFSFFPDSSSARAFKCLIASAALLLLDRSCSHMYRPQSSTSKRSISSHRASPA